MSEPADELHLILDGILLNKYIARGSMKSYFNFNSLGAMISMASRNAFRLINSLLVVCFLLAGSMPAAAASFSQTQNKLSTSRSHDLKDPQQVKAFVDGFFVEQMLERHIPGAVFVLVKDGTIVMAQGFRNPTSCLQSPYSPIPGH
jgi:hypothetical protein